MWGVVLLSCFVAGCVMTVVMLRYAARQRTSQLRQMVQSGQILWGGQVRWRLGERSWGLSGQLVLSPDGYLQWSPDAPSQKRGAKPSVWRLAEVELEPLRKTRDISGAAFTEYQISTENRSIGRFGMFHEVGRRPDSTM